MEMIMKRKKMFIHTTVYKKKKYEKRNMHACACISEEMHTSLRE